MARGQVARIPAFTSLADSMPASISSFLSYCRSKNLSDNSIIYYTYRLEAFRRYLEENAPETTPASVTVPLIRRFITAECSRNSPSTANHSIGALRAFFNYLVRDGFVDTNPAAQVEKVRQRKAIIATFTMEQVDQLLAVCGRDFIGARDRAIILLLVDCGLRASELCEITLDKISWSDQTILVCGKGEKERYVSFGQTTRSALNQYLARRGELEVGELFVSCYAEPIDRHRLGGIIASRCREVGITGVRCSPHTLRHTFAVHYLRNGGDVFSLQKILGHSDLTMTRRYVELSELDVRQKHQMFSPADRLESARAGSRKRLR